MPLALEDNFDDVINKALRGLKLADSEAAARAGLPTTAVVALRRGDFDEFAVRRLAPALGLHADALVALGKKQYAPSVAAPDGLHRATTSWHDMLVNAYLVWDPATGEAAIFDTGADASPLIAEIVHRGLKPKTVYITHTHPDHIAALSAFSKLEVVTHRLEPVAGARLIEEGFTAKIGSLHLSARLTCGHAVAGLTYVIQGLERPLAIVGDALFAGSMGGGKVSWEDALRTNRESIFTLPDDTVICPGHGPLTTAGLEKGHNPCYPEFKPYHT